MQPISFASSEFNVPPVRKNGVKYSQAANSRHYEKQTQDGIDARQRRMAKAYRDAVNMANLTDKQLLAIAKKDAHRDDKHKMKTYAAALVGIPALDVAAKGVLTKAPKLSGKLSTMGKAAVGWGGVFALAGLYNGAVEKVTAVSPVFKRFEEKHPALSSLLGLTGFAATIIGAEAGVDKLAKVLPKKFPGVASDLGKMSAKVANVINESKITKKVLKPLKDKVVAFALKNPKATKVGVATLAFAAPALAVGALFKGLTDKAEKSEQIKETYNKLAKAREANRKAVQLVNSRIINEPLAVAANIAAQEAAVAANLDVTSKGGVVSKNYAINMLA